MSGPRSREERPASLVPPSLPPAAVVEADGPEAGRLVAAFGATLAARGWRVGQGDLLLVERFTGPSQPIGTALAQGTPLVTTVTPDQLPDWERATGGAGVVLAPRAPALWRWWGPHRLYPDLVLGVAELPVRRVVIGLNWVLVEGPDGCGLAFTPRPPGGCRALPMAGQLAGGSLQSLARLATSLDPLQASLGVAAVNAHYNRFDLEGETTNGLDELTAVSGPAVAVGRFPGMVERRPDVRIIERNPAPGDYPEAAAAWLLPTAAVAVLTSSTLPNHSLPGLLGQATTARRVLVGPGTPLTARLFSYGLDVLAGLVVTDPEGAARVIAESGAVKALKPFTRSVTLRRPESS